MNFSIAKRRTFLASEKNSGHRITIGFTGIADFRSFIGQEYIAGMMKAASDYDINFINFAGAIKYSLFDDIDFISHYLKNFQFMKKPLVDGLVTWASSLCSFLDNETVEKTFTALKPIPMVDIGHLNIPGVPSIRIDNGVSISLIIEHLVKVHDYERFIFIGCDNSIPHKRRADAYHNELLRLGITELPDSVYLAESMESPAISRVVDEVLLKYDLKDHNQIDCIITSSDIIASAVIDELDKRGINVPQDVAVTGFNNQYTGITAHSPVTTINLEYFKRGYSAVEFLIDRIMAPEENFESKYVNVSLLVRQSCGCFEKSIIDAGMHLPARETFSINSTNSEDELRDFLSKKVREIFYQESNQEIQNLVDAILFDIYDQNVPGELLRWFQRLLKDSRKKTSLENASLQHCITSLRNIILPMVKDDEPQYHHMEDIFNQLRALIAVFIEYDTIASRTNSYLSNNLSQIAINFASATSGKQIQEVLKYQLNEMEIPGIVLALTDNISADLNSANIELVIPDPAEHIKSKLPYKVKEPAMIPKTFFTQGKRFSVMLETLYHHDQYFGYAFLEIGNPNISIYDTVRLLLSNALSTVYQNEGRTIERSTALKDEQISGILNMPAKFDPEERKRGLKSTQITDYLLKHLNEMTNLDQMASELSVSKSHLVRRAKELTGYTIQSLHEKLKIEQAKNLLQLDSLKLSEISERLGFQNQNYFSSVFKKNTGMSPRAWAKRYK